MTIPEQKVDSIALREKIGLTAAEKDQAASIKWHKKTSHRGWFLEILVGGIATERYL
jgi:hypothetical protein